MPGCTALLAEVVVERDGTDGREQDRRDSALRTRAGGGDQCSRCDDRDNQAHGSGTLARVPPA